MSSKNLFQLCVPTIPYLKQNVSTRLTKSRTLPACLNTIVICSYSTNRTDNNNMPTSSIRFHSKRHNKTAQCSQVTVSKSADCECTACDKLAVAAMRMTTQPPRIPERSPGCSRVPDFLHQVELPDPPSVDRDSAQHSASFNVSACENRTPVQPQPVPMSFFRRAASHIQSLTAFGNSARAYQPDFTDNDEFSNDSQYSATEACANAPSHNKKTQHVVHVLHQGTEGKFRSF